MLKKFLYAMPKKLLIIIGSFFAIALLVLGLIGSFVWKVSQDLPPVSKLRDYEPPVPSVLYDREGKILMLLGNENRKLVEYKDTPQVVIDAVLAAEDDQFFEHRGVDLVGIIRAMINNIKAGRFSQGGSTITQQVAKSLLLTSEKTWSRKIKDFLLAIKIEQSFTKEEILYLYLNQVYLGGGYYGIQAAVKGYFGKDLKDITIAEAALLAGLLSAPGRYSPYVNPEFAKRRQNYVLEQMYNKDRITEEAYDAAKNQVINLQNERKPKLQAPYFSEWIRQLMVTAVGEESFLMQGFQIKSTIDLDIQIAAEEAIDSGTRAIDKRQGFKGPIAQVSSEKLIDYEVELVQKIYKEFSDYKMFFPDGTLKEQYDFKAEEETQFRSNLISYYQSAEIFSKQWGMPLFPQPYYDLKTLSFLRKKEDYPAVVLKVNDRLRLIFCTIGGVIGVIPFEHFKWAHKRKISEETTFAYQYVEKPSTIVKPGDVVLIRIIEDQKKPLNSVVASNLVDAKKPEIKKYLSETNFMIFSLEQIPEVQSSVIVLSPQNGDLLAMIGGNSFAQSKFNRALQSLRQAGSTAKPIIYAAAMEKGLTSASILMDTPQSLAGLDNVSTWKPKNYDNEFKGLITFRTSLQESRNVSTINLLQKIGIDYVLDFAKRLQIKAPITPDMSISLGSFGINLFEMTKAYAIFPGKGKMIPEKKVFSITDRFGKNRIELVEIINKHQTAQDLAVSLTPTPTPTFEPTLVATDDKKEQEAKAEEKPTAEVTPEPTPTAEKIIDYVSGLKGDQVYDERLSFIMCNLLKGVIQAGTGQDAKDLGPYYGGKTGTTSSYVDAWFVGFSQQVATGVWVGFDNNTTLGYGETGSAAALPIWKYIMEKVSKKYPPTEFNVPRGVSVYPINVKTGKLSSINTSEVIQDFFVTGTQPGGSLDKDTQATEKGPVLDDDYWSNQ
jgi:penicillin-binding protein 1A